MGARVNNDLVSFDNMLFKGIFPYFMFLLLRILMEIIGVGLLNVLHHSLCAFPLFSGGVGGT